MPFHREDRGDRQDEPEETAADEQQGREHAQPIDARKHEGEEKQHWDRHADRGRADHPRKAEAATEPTVELRRAKQREGERPRARPTRSRSRFVEDC